ncbi:MAG: HAD hydrolase family protein [Treponema sp.]|jgi:hypothetical protein|nr:HAD hydrolase family protein [Treponema sp.]
MKNITEMTKDEAAGIRFILMDIDDTLTQDGNLPRKSYSALWDLKDAGLRVIPVTGRPAGWCDLITREWPVDGVVGENGALAFWEEDQDEGGRFLKQEFHPNAVRNDHPTLERIRIRALAEVPGLRVAKDQFAQLFDLALDFAEEKPALSLKEAEKARRIAEEEGAIANISSISCERMDGDLQQGCHGGAVSFSAFRLAARLRRQGSRFCRGFPQRRAHVRPIPPVLRRGKHTPL